MNKSAAFSFLIDKFIDWYKEVKVDEEYFNKFTKLFLLKMLFLVAAIKTDDSEDLLDVFDNFYALPYGPVESDIYNEISLNMIPNFLISDRQLEPKIDKVDLDLRIDDRTKLCKSFDKLRGENNDLITLKAFELVEITHKWESWNTTFKYAKFIGAGSAKMNIDMIKNDKNKHFGQ